MIYFILAAVFINIAVFIMYGTDKRKAVKKKQRISERTLILSAFILGGIGALLGMTVFHHKTKHLKFKILVPVAVLVNIIIIVGVIYLGKRNIPSF